MLDFGLAIAGPFGPQILADLGATVLKITTREFDLTDAIYVGSSHGKQALALDLKDPRGARRSPAASSNGPTSSITTCAPASPNASASATSRPGPSTRRSSTATAPADFERDGPRTPLPGNDQLGHALAGDGLRGGRGRITGRRRSGR